MYLCMKMHYVQWCKLFAILMYVKYITKKTLCKLMEENNLNLDFNLTWSPFALLSFWHGDSLL